MSDYIIYTSIYYIHIYLSVPSDPGCPAPSLPTVLLPGLLGEVDQEEEEPRGLSQGEALREVLQGPDGQVLRPHV